MALYEIVERPKKKAGPHAYKWGWLIEAINGLADGKAIKIAMETRLRADSLRGVIGQYKKRGTIKPVTTWYATEEQALYIWLKEVE